jgi:6-phosphogluconolactonase
VPSPFEVVVDRPERLASLFSSRLKDAQRKEPWTLAVPGGSVAEQFFPALASAHLDWRRLHLFWCDERAVPPDHPDSNYRIAAERLLSSVPIAAANVHRMKAEGPDLARAAVDYEEELISIAGDRRRVDVALLGVGPDGHVCSLFPAHSALEERSRLVLAIADSPKPPPLRLTLTLPALKRALVVFAAFGASKAAVIREAIRNPASELPVARAARQAAHALFLLDFDAAGDWSPAEDHRQSH